MLNRSLFFLLILSSFAYAADPPDCDEVFQPLSGGPPPTETVQESGTSPTKSKLGLNAFLTRLGGFLSSFQAQKSPAEAPTVLRVGNRIFPLTEQGTVGIPIQELSPLLVERIQNDPHLSDSQKSILLRANRQGAFWEESSIAQLKEFFRDNIPLRVKRSKIARLQEKLSQVEGEEREALRKTLDEMQLVPASEFLSPEKVDEQVDAFLKKFSEAEVTINFNPEKAFNGRQVMDGFLESDHYGNTEETGVTGGQGVWPGGGSRRSQVERSMFPELLSAEAGEKPKYAAINFSGRESGGAPAYGEAYLVLNDSVKQRSTLVREDSLDAASTAEDLLSFEYFGRALSGTDRHKVLQMFLWMQGYEADVSQRAGFYPEAQVFQRIQFSRDVKAIAAPKRYQGTEMGEKFKKFAEKHKIELRWITPESS